MLPNANGSVSEKVRKEFEIYGGCDKFSLKKKGSGSFICTAC